MLILDPRMGYKVTARAVQQSIREGVATVSVLLDNQGRHRVGDGVPVNEVLARFGMSTPVTTAATSWPVHVPSSRLVVRPQPSEEPEDTGPRRSGGKMPATVLAAVVGLGIPGALLATNGLGAPESISAMGYDEVVGGAAYHPPVYSGSTKPRDDHQPKREVKPAAAPLPHTVAGVGTGTNAQRTNPWSGRPAATKVDAEQLQPAVATTGVVTVTKRGTTARITEPRTPLPAVPAPLQQPATGNNIGSSSQRSDPNNPLCLLGVCGGG
jgi:hypothetical protein